MKILNIFLAIFILIILNSCSDFKLLTQSDFNKNNPDYSTGSGGSGSISSPSWMLAISSYSDFTAWSTPNATTAPDGSNTAYSINSYGGGPNAYYIKGNLSGLTIGNSYTFGIFAKAGSLDQFWFNDSDSTLSIEFDLTDGIVQTAHMPAEGSSYGIISVGNGWYYCYGTFTTTSSNQTFCIGEDNKSNWTYTSYGDSVYIWQGSIL